MLTEVQSVKYQAAVHHFRTRSFNWLLQVLLFIQSVVLEIPNIRTYVSVDGGMTDNPICLYRSQYEAVVANKANLERNKTVTISGNCESGTLLVRT